MFPETFKHPITLGSQGSLYTIQTFLSFYRRGNWGLQRGQTCPRLPGKLYSSFPLVYLTPLFPGRGIESNSGHETVQVTEHFWASVSSYTKCPNFLGLVRFKWDKVCRALSVVSMAELFLLFYLILAIALWGIEDLFWFACFGKIGTEVAATCPQAHS